MPCARGGPRRARPHPRAGRVAGRVVSNIFESAGGVDGDGGDVAAAESQRSAMLDIKAEAMDPVAAARVVFDRPPKAGSTCSPTRICRAAMTERANVLASQRAPTLRTHADSIPQHSDNHATRTGPRRRRPGRRLRRPRTDAPARPGRRPRRPRVCSLPDTCPPWLPSKTTWRPVRPARSRSPLSTRERRHQGRRAVFPRRRNGFRLQPFLRTTGQDAAAASDAT